MTPSSGRQPRRKRDRHGWNAIQGYFNAHERCLDELKNYFIEAETLSITTIGTGSIQIEGRIVCKHGLFLDVLKTLELNDRR